MRENFQALCTGAAHLSESAELGRVKTEESERNVAKTVWQSTKQYLEELGRKMRERCVEAVMELLGREKV